MTERTGSVLGAQLRDSKRQNLYVCPFLKLGSFHLYFSSYRNKKLAQERIGMHLGFNQQLWDLGMSTRELADSQSVQKKIEDIDRDFLLVMIAERLPESLVLLADLLCLPLYVMTSLKVNARKESKKVVLF